MIPRQATPYTIQDRGPAGHASDAEMPIGARIVQFDDVIRS
jgi:hypothetical protein